MLQKNMLHIQVNESCSGRRISNWNKQMCQLYGKVAGNFNHKMEKDLYRANQSFIALFGQNVYKAFWHN